ncbi:MAG: cytidine deaminase [Bacteroidales bacterium]|nr:cytidine deaminase [Bacteroidales bacterium]
MKEIEIKMTYREYPDLHDLPEDEQMLVSEAVAAASGAYAPYSRFMVGAAMLFNDGSVIRGANVENAAYPSGSCAEKTVLSYAISNYPGKKSVAIAIAALSGGKLTREPVPPCGNCRQMLLEEEKRQGSEIKVILTGKDKIIELKNCESLMPLHFTKSNLES